MTTRAQANTYLLTLISKEVLNSASGLSWVHTLYELCSLFGSDVAFTQNPTDNSRFTLLVNDVLLIDGSSGVVKIELIVSGTTSLDGVSNLLELKALMTDTSVIKVYASTISQYKESKSTTNMNTPPSDMVDDFDVTGVISKILESKFQMWLSANKPNVSHKYTSAHGSFTRISTSNFVTINKSPTPILKHVVLDIDTSFLWAFELDKSFNGVDYDAQKYPDIHAIAKGLLTRTPNIEAASFVKLIKWLSSTKMVKEDLLVVGSNSSSFKVSRLFVD